MIAIAKNLFKRKVSKNPLDEKISSEQLEIRLEKRLIYVLHLLSVNAFRKSNKKSLPAKRQITMSFEGPLMSKTYTQWGAEFTRKAVGEILNQDVHKMRFYIDVDIHEKSSGIWPNGRIIIAMHYSIHR